MFNFGDALQRYRVAKHFGLSFISRIKIFLFGKGTPKENFEKMINNEKK